MNKQKFVPIIFFAVLSICVLVFAGCNLWDNDGKANTNNNTVIEEDPDVDDPSYEEGPDVGSPSYEQWLEILDGWRAELQPIIAGMSPAQKYGQMTQGLMSEIDGASTTTFPSIETTFLGSVLAGGHDNPIAAQGGNTPTGWRTFTNSVVTSSLNSVYPLNVKIPCIFGLDCIHGASKVMNATMLPHNIGLGAIAVGDEERGKKAAYQAGELTSREMLEAGLRWTFAPVLGTAKDARWGRTYECYSEDVDIVTFMGGSFIRGLHKAGVASTPKNFGSESQVVNGSSSGSPYFTIDEYRESAAPYEAAIRERSMSIIMSYGSRNGVRIHEDKELMTDFLKGEMGFPGMILTDWSSLSNVSGATYADKVANGINAGIDMVMAASNNWRETIEALSAKVNDGTISQERIDDAVMRCLLFKKSIGHQSKDPLHNFWENPTMTGPAGKIRTDEHREIARAMVSDSLVLLKDEGKVISQLKDMNNILMVGNAANNIGLQCGGWTVGWQGDVNLQTAGVTIVEGIRKAHGTSRVAYAATAAAVTATAGTSFDAIIAVVSETPYAEGSGDRNDQTYIKVREMPSGTGQTNVVTVDFLTSIKATHPSTPVVLIILSGRPISLVPQLLEVDAIVAAWLPGSEGDGIANVLFGDRDFVGKTSYTWFASIADMIAENPTYAFGHGLRK